MREHKRKAREMERWVCVRLDNVKKKNEMDMRRKKMKRKGRMRKVFFRCWLFVMGVMLGLG
jgi:hypothetical protein